MRIVVTLLLFTGAQSHRKNVCKNFLDYNFRDISPNCWYNADAEDRSENIIARHGYPLEQYEVVTEDSFILKVFRITPKSDNVKGIVFLQHPALASSSVWISSGNDSFAFLLSDAGYDVWLGNFRATSYSEKHMTLSKHKNPSQYWNHSFHEFGVYDLPAQIELVRNITGFKQKLIYIGHSVATTAALVYSSLKPKEAEKHIELLILWSPIAFLGNVRTPGKLFAPFTQIIKTNLDLLQIRGNSYDGLPHKLVKLICLSIPSLLNFCSKLIDFAVGPQNEGGNPTELPVLFYQSLEGSSVKTLAHFGQLVQSKDRFQWYDYGFLKNKAYYNSRGPPEYPLKKVGIPVRLVYGGNDYFSTEKDVTLLYSQLQEKVKMGLEKFENLSHFDFHYGKGIKELLHVSTINYLDEYVKKDIQYDVIDP